MGSERRRSRGPSSGVKPVISAQQDGFVFEIGPTLRETRVRRRLTLQQVEEDIKIRARYLQALEDEDFGILPGQAYTKGFLHSYAAYLGLDPKIFLEEFNSRYAQPDPQEQLSGPSALRRPPHSRRKSGLVFFAVVAVLVLAAIYLLGWHGGRDDELPKVNPSVLSPSSSASPSPSPGQSSTSPAPTGASTVVVEAKTASCYIEVFSGSLQNAALYADTLAQGDRKTFRPKGTLYIRVGGEPNALAIWLNDSAVKTSSDPSGVVYVFNKGQVTTQ